MSSPPPSLVAHLDRFCREVRVSGVSASMAPPPPPVMAVLLFGLVLANVGLSAGNVVKGKISCLDCRGRKATNLSGIKVLVKCDKVKKFSTATTTDSGYFETELPSAPAAVPSSTCLATVLGGPRQLYATRTGIASKIVRARDGSGRSYFTTSTPLTVSTTSGPKEKKASSSVVHTGEEAEFGSSKTVDLPVPREWGLAPTSYYLPFVPIIGVP